MSTLGGTLREVAKPPALPVPQRARVALAASEAKALLCDFEAAEHWLADARAHLDPAADAQVEGDAFIVESVLAKTCGQRERELSAFESAIAFYAANGAPERLSIARMWASYERSFTQPEIESSLGLEPPGRAWPQAGIAWDALWSAARALGLSFRNPATSAALFPHAADQARQVGMVRLEIVTMINAGAARQGTGDMDMASDCFDLAATRARATGWPTLIGAAETRVGELLQTLGALEESRTLLGEAILQLSVVPRSLHVAIACASLAQTLLAMGRPVESLEPMSEAIAMYRETGFSHNLALNLIFQARVMAAAGRADEALAALEEAQACHRPARPRWPARRPNKASTSGSPRPSCPTRTRCGRTCSRNPAGTSATRTAPSRGPACACPPRWARTTSPASRRGCATRQAAPTCAWQRRRAARASIATWRNWWGLPRAVRARIPIGATCAATRPSST